MTESTENLSLFSEEELPKARKPARARSAKTLPAATTEASEPAAKPAKTTRAKAKPTAAKAEPKTTARKTKAKATPEPAPAPVEAEAAAPKKTTRKRTPAKTAEATAPAAPAAPISAPAPIGAAAPAPRPARATPARKPRARTAEPTGPAPRPPGEIPPAEEWKPGARARAEERPEPSRPAASQPPAEPTPRPQTERAPVERPQAERSADRPSEQPQRPAYGQGQGQGQGHYRRDREGGGGRHRNFRNRDRDRHNRGNFRDRDRDPRGGDPRGGDPRGDYPRESSESRDQRIAAARHEFAHRGDLPHHDGGGAEEESPAEPVFAEGIVEVSGKGFGFLRDPKRNFNQHPQDIFVTPEVCRRHILRDGMWIKGEIRRGNRGMQLYKLTEIEGEDPEKHRVIPLFEELTTINPNRFIKLETTPERYTTRVIDLMAPIGRGQRGLIVAPPRTGKTTLLQHIAEALIANHPDMKLIILLVDERPEEVTEIRRTVPQAEIMASSNDSEIKSHTRIAQLAIERARRLVEMGKHVFVLLDSITRVGRAFNNATGGGGRTMSGGVDSRALEIPRKLFASARNTEEAGSLTIIATALIETGSRMDDLIFQEFKGTGNMELVLDRKISDLRVYPAVDIFQSGTRREELLLPEADLHKINLIRRGLAGHRPAEAIERLLSFLKRFPTNAQMLREIPG